MGSGWEEEDEYKFQVHFICTKLRFGFVTQYLVTYALALHQANNLWLRKKPKLRVLSSQRGPMLNVADSCWPAQRGQGGGGGGRGPLLAWAPGRFLSGFQRGSSRAGLDAPHPTQCLQSRLRPGRLRSGTSPPAHTGSTIWGVRVLAAWDKSSLSPKLGYKYLSSTAAQPRLRGSRLAHSWVRDY